MLIIDDDPAPAQFIAAKLPEASVEPDILTSPLLALEAIECANPDLLARLLHARLSRIKAYAAVKKANLWSPEANC